MYVPEVKKCCFCFPLRSGIILFGIINIVFSSLAIACLVVNTELKKLSITHESHDSYLEVATATVLYGIFGMGVMLNGLLLVAACQKDVCMFRLYNYYALMTTLAALVATLVLLSRLLLVDVCVAFGAIVMQCYVIVMVRSEVVKLERQLQAKAEGEEYEAVVDVPDRETLM